MRQNESFIDAENSPVKNDFKHQMNLVNTLEFIGIIGFELTKVPIKLLNGL